MQDEDEGAARLGTGRREMHRRTARHDDMSSPCAPDHLAFGSFQTRLTCERVPGLRPRMPMCGRRHARCEDRLHVLRRVFRIGVYWKRTDLGDARAAGWTPPTNVDREKPHFSKGLHNGSTRSLGRFRFGTRRIGVQVPEDRRLWELPQRRIGRDPATQFTCSLADWPADLRQCFLARGECHSKAREGHPQAA